ncbi:FlgD immunoglobulin-like domain containing protein [Candidatus Eisenbacteria bacterium]|uniref:FlgD immunoglobulin-like domain containing protein n=1 Tax=Eiseniibacteriota bacterium TaxID=2212470 RepID=A0ABV6YKS6_UNCEI
MRASILTLRVLVLANILLALFATPDVAEAQVIDFETLPDGSPVTDGMVITNQYIVQPYGVTFELLGAPPGTGPRIAKVGPPMTAFVGPELANPPCGVTTPTTDDTPAAGEGVGCFFLTDDGVGAGGASTSTLRITYAAGVSQASGVILDVQSGLGPDCPGPNLEEWVITARDSTDQIMDTIHLEECDPGTGDGVGTLWIFADLANDICAIEIEYQGVGTPGLGFDNFSPSTIPANLSVSKSTTTSTAALGDTLHYELTVTNAGPGDASAVVLEDILPPGVSFLTVAPSQGACGEFDGLITCELGDVLSGGAATVEVTGILEQVFVSNTATVVASEFDEDTSDNHSIALTEVDCETAGLPTESEALNGRTRVYQNTPNPFGPHTQIRLSLEKDGVAEVDIYDASGRRVRRLISERLVAGPRQIVWDGRDDSGEAVASGSYFYQLRMDGKQVGTQKALLIR